jgi:uncharacterized protein (DUF433 family)
VTPAYAERISVNPAVMVGKPVIRGTRIPVDLIVRMVAQGITNQEILEAYPHIAVEDIKAALLYAADAVWEMNLFPSNEA